MQGKACIRGMRVTVGTVVGLVACGHSWQEILDAYPYLEEEDIRQSLTYAAYRVQEREIELPASDLETTVTVTVEPFNDRVRIFRSNPRSCSEGRPIHSNCDGIGPGSRLRRRGSN